MNLRAMRWRDIEAATEIEADLFGSDAWSAETFRAELAGVPRSRYYVAAEVAGRLVGYAGLAWAGVDDVTETDVQTVAVARDSQGEGIGRALIDELLASAIGRGSTACLLEVRADNRVAIGLYESVGFGVIAKRTKYYSDGVDALVMRTRPGPSGAEGSQESLND